MKQGKKSKELLQRFLKENTTESIFTSNQNFFPEQIVILQGSGREISVEKLTEKNKPGIVKGGKGKFRLYPPERHFETTGKSEAEVLLKMTTEYDSKLFRELILAASASENVVIQDHKYTIKDFRKLVLFIAKPENKIINFIVSRASIGLLEDVLKEENIKNINIFADTDSLVPIVLAIPDSKYLGIRGISNIYIKKEIDGTYTGHLNYFLSILNPSYIAVMGESELFKHSLNVDKFNIKQGKFKRINNYNNALGTLVK